MDRIIAGESFDGDRFSVGHVHEEKDRHGAEELSVTTRDAQQQRIDAGDALVGNEIDAVAAINGVRAVAAVVENDVGSVPPLIMSAPPLPWMMSAHHAPPSMESAAARR